MKIKVQAMLCLALAATLATQMFLEFNNSQAGRAEAETISGRTFYGESRQESSLSELAERNFIRLSGGWEWLSSGQGHPLASSRFNDAVIEGAFTGTRLDLYTRLSGQVLEVELDQKPPVSLNVPRAEGFNYVTLAHDLPATQHRFRLRLADRRGGQMVARSLRTSGNWVKGKFNRRPRLLGFGSSSIDGCGIVWNLAEARGWEAINRGIGGTTVTREGQFRVEQDVLPYQPEAILLNYGSNDWFGNVPLAEFKPAYLNMLKQIATGAPQARLVVLGLYPRTNGNEITRPQFNQAIREAITEAGLAGRATYYEIQDYNFATDTSDGTHPRQDVVKAKFIPQLLPFFQNAEPVATGQK